MEKKEKVILNMFKNSLMSVNREEPKKVWSLLAASIMLFILYRSTLTLQKRSFVT